MRNYWTPVRKLPTNSTIRDVIDNGEFLIEKLIERKKECEQKHSDENFNCTCEKLTSQIEIVRDFIGETWMTSQKQP